jgi:hypothetical protein
MDGRAATVAARQRRLLRLNDLPSLPQFNIETGKTFFQKVVDCSRSCGVPKWAPLRPDSRSRAAIASSSVGGLRIEDSRERK